LLDLSFSIFYVDDLTFNDVNNNNASFILGWKDWGSKEQRFGSEMLRESTHPVIAYDGKRGSKGEG